MSEPPADALSALRDIVGGESLLTCAADVAPYCVDQHGRVHGKALAVALPSSTAQVSALLRHCHANRVAVVPQGGNTGYCAGATPDASGHQLVIALARLNAVREIDAANFTVTVEAGCVLERLHELCAAAGRFFPLSLGSSGSCQIGGNLATNAGGLNVLRYGVARDLALGLEVVLADGTIVSDLRGLRKNNAGYDLRNLFIGAEGTLGIITAATLKLFPVPAQQISALVAVRDVAAAVELLAQLRVASGDDINGFELLPGRAIDMVRQHLPGPWPSFEAGEQWFVLVELSSTRQGTDLKEVLTGGLEPALEAGIATDAIVAQSESQRQALWRLRESIPAAQRRAGYSLRHDISVPISRLAQFVESATDDVRHAAPGLELVCYGHVGDGNLHFNLLAKDADIAQPEAATLTRLIHDRVAALGGSFSAEHGIGQTKLEELLRYAAPTRIRLMREIKVMLDPRGIMNPGKVLQAPAANPP
ncbi:MAG: FAD-binding oxidoreductase [Steroidobacteraceae bacterium]